MKLNIQCFKHLKTPLKPKQFSSLTQTTNHNIYFQISPHTFKSLSINPFFHILGLSKTSFTLKIIHSLLLTHGLATNILFQTKLVSLYGQFGQIKNARKVFDTISEKDGYSCKVMMRSYFLNDLYSELLRLYNFVWVCLDEVDNVVFSIVLKACSELRDVYEGGKVHCRIAKVGGPDNFVLTGLLDMYAKCEQIECSRRVFDEIFDKNVVSWTSMIVGYVQNDCAEEGLILFNRMRNSLVEGNQYTYGSIVTGCTKLGALHQGKWAHGYLIKKRIVFNSFLVTNLVDMYIKCGSIRDARRVFEEFHMIDLVLWTAMIVGYTQSGNPTEALKMFTDDKWHNILPNGVTIASVLSACGQLGNSMLGRTIHCLGTKLGLQDINVVNALIDMYAKCRMIVEARYVFETVSANNLIAWNVIISGYSQNGNACEGLKLFNQMRSEQLSPDSVTLVTVISACTSLGAFPIGCSLHAYCTKEGLVSSHVFVGTALVNFYAKSGDSISARAVFDEMREKNKITWASMIGGYAMQGDGNGSVALFNDMLKQQSEPNDVIFTCVLSACSHTGMVGEGLEYFNLICEKYNFVPSHKHYVCTVDLLARAGRLEEAWTFIENMKIEPDVGLYGAFLHGCNLHSRFDLGELAAKRMLELHPGEACYYVLLFNMYSRAGKWKHADQVRDLMKERGLFKAPGLSLVDMDTSNGLSHSRVASVDYFLRSNISFCINYSDSRCIRNLSY